MSDTTLTSGARDAVHLFAVDIDEDAFWGFVQPDPDTGDWPLKDALGVETLDAGQVEGAVVEDLEGIGLSGFLIEGIGVNEALIAPDRARLDALSGPVAIIRGAAFDGAHVPLSPSAPLRHLETYEMVRAASTFEALESAAAMGTTAPAPRTAPPPARNRWLLWMLIAAAALILLALLTGTIL